MENITEIIKYFFQVITKKIPSIFLFFSFVLLVMISYDSFNIKHFLIKEDKQYPLYKYRRLTKHLDNEIKLNNDSAFTKYLNYIQFIQNLTENEYTGKWNSTKSQLDYDNKFGHIEMRIIRPSYEDLLLENETRFFLRNSVRLDIIITDGPYSDRFVNFNITLNITDILPDLTNNNKEIIINKENVLTNISFWEIIEKVDTKGIFSLIKKEISQYF